MTITTVDELLDYWPGNIPFKGSLVSDDGSCMCAQGQALHLLGGMSVADLRNIEQAEADMRVAELMGISRAHAILLRNVNDGRPGAPSVVIRNPAAVLGDQAHIVLAFWGHLDRMAGKQWDAARAAARAAAGDAARAAAGATNEIQGAAIMRAKGQEFYFLPIFGFAGPEAVLAAEAAA